MGPVAVERTLQTGRSGRERRGLGGKGGRTQRHRFTMTDSDTQTILVKCESA